MTSEAAGCSMLPSAAQHPCLLGRRHRGQAGTSCSSCLAEGERRRPEDNGAETGTETICKAGGRAKGGQHGGWRAGTAARPAGHQLLVFILAFALLKCSPGQGDK